MGPNPTEPAPNLSLYLDPPIYYHDNIVALIEQNPMDNFLYALKSSESKRQYPKRFEKFLNFLGLQGSLHEKAIKFVMKAQLDIQWADSSFMKFLEFQKSRNLQGEIATGTVVNYYRATKLFYYRATKMQNRPHLVHINRTY